MRETGFSDTADYVSYAVESEPERLLFIQSLSNSATRFFRDKDSFFHLSELLRSILNEFGLPIKAWSIGCADGAEPYTLAIIFHELGIDYEGIQILGTDVDESLLALARKGQFPKDHLKEVDPSLVSTCFVHEDHSRVSIHQNLAKSVHFRKLSLFEADDQVNEGNFSLISCRNVLIYFEATAKINAISVISQRLLSGGILFLGRTEVLPLEFSDEFTTLSFEDRIYRKR
jgi:chemotaxis protein methyltransferase CheR